MDRATFIPLDDPAHAHSKGGIHRSINPATSCLIPAVLNVMPNVADKVMGRGTGRYGA